MERRYATYRPASRWRPLRSRVRLFPGIRLNLIGRTAVVVLCLAGAGVGYAGGRLVGLPVGLGMVGGGLAVLAGLVAVGHGPSRH